MLPTKQEIKRIYWKQYYATYRIEIYKLRKLRKQLLQRILKSKHKMTLQYILN